MMDDTRDRGLIKAFRRLVLRPSSPNRKNEGKPLPPAPPSRPPTYGSSGGPTAASLPPYLAHLAAEPSNRHPTVPFPQPLHYGTNAPNPALHSYARPSNPLPRPPTFVASPNPPGTLPHAHAHAHNDNSHPLSLLPGPDLVLLGATKRVPYPWELVPQEKTQASPHHAAGATASRPVAEGKENGSPPKKPVLLPHSQTVALVTPPRKPQRGQPTGLRTPNGSQKDAKYPPVKGQCWGITKDGSRCSRFPRHANLSPAKNGARTDRAASVPVRSPNGSSASQPMVIADSDSEDDSLGSPRGKGRARSTPPATPARAGSGGPADFIDEIYCHQHVKEVNKTTGFNPSRPQGVPDSSANDTFIDFGKWLDTTQLSAHTQALLRKCMSRHLAAADLAERGYLYIYEFRDRSTSTQLCLKVGRTTNVFKRLGQWRSKCQSKDPLLRAFHPSAQGQGLISGADWVEVEGVHLSHRWETLVHLELASIGHRIDEVCHDCGLRHREMFMIPRTLKWNDGQRKDGFELVQRIVTKWMQFVQILS